MTNTVAERINDLSRDIGGNYGRSLMLRQAIIELLAIHPRPQEVFAALEKHYKDRESDFHASRHSPEEYQAQLEGMKAELDFLQRGYEKKNHETDQSEV